MRTKVILEIENFNLDISYCQYCADKYGSTKKNSKFCTNECRHEYNNILKSHPELSDFTERKIPLCSLWRVQAKTIIVEQMSWECLKVIDTDERVMCACVDFAFEELNYPPFDYENFCGRCNLNVIKLIMEN